MVGLCGPVQAVPAPALAWLLLPVPAIQLGVIPVAVIPSVAIPVAVFRLAVVPLGAGGIAEGIEDLILAGLETHLALVVNAIAVLAGLGGTHIMAERRIEALPFGVAGLVVPVCQAIIVQPAMRPVTILPVDRVVPVGPAGSAVRILPAGERAALGLLA